MWKLIKSRINRKYREQDVVGPFSSVQFKDNQQQSVNTMVPLVTQPRSGDILANPMYQKHTCLPRTTLKQKPHGVRRPEEGALTPQMPLEANPRKDKAVNTPPTGRWSTGKNHQWRARTGKMYIACLLEEANSPGNWANENPSSPWILAFLQQTRVQTTPPNFLLFLYKVIFLFFVGWTCLWLFAIACSS